MTTVKQPQTPRWETRKAARRREREVEMRVQDEARRREEARRAALSMYERISESDASADVKEILHMLAEKVGLE